MSVRTSTRPPLRILHVIRSGEFAGVEQFVRRLASAQAGAGHRVAVVGGAPAQLRDPLRAAGVGFRPARFTAAVVTAALSNSPRVDVINSHMTAADIGAVIGRTMAHTRPAIVSTRHFAQRRGSTGPSGMYRLIERSIDQELSISRAVAEAIGVESTIVHPGVARIDARAEARRERTVLIAQRLEREKHTELGIRAFAASGLADQGWTLEIAGTGAEATALRAMADPLGLGDAIRFLGFRDDVPSLMRSAALFLATCPLEHFGLSVLESMASGLPVIAARAGGHVEMLAGLDPRALFTPDDATAAAASLRSLADDELGRVALGTEEQQRQRDRFSLDAQVEGTDAAYRIAIARRRARTEVRRP